jgi:cyclic dehypoxanthinyl futalosine synthase
LLPAAAGSVSAFCGWRVFGSIPAFSHWRRVIENIQSSWVTQGLKTCQLGLRVGGNDVGSIMIEENVVSAAGAHHRASEEEVRRIIRDAGLIPKQRDTLYRTYFLN